jgi:hypothetical protein
MIMPSDRSINTPSTDEAVRPPEADTADTTATSAIETATTAGPSTVPDTAATRALWAALTGQPGATTADLAIAAKISRSAAAKTLAALEVAGRALRTPGAREGARLLPDRWQPAEAGDLLELGMERVPGVPATRVSVDETQREEALSTGVDVATGTEAAAEGEPAVEETAAGEKRLGAGKLREMVLAHLRDHDDQDFSPSAMGKVMQRSSGAIANACEKLISEQLITQTSDKPRRYRSAATEQ